MIIEWNEFPLNVIMSPLTEQGPLCYELPSLQMPFEDFLSSLFDATVVLRSGYITGHSARVFRRRAQNTSLTCATHNRRWFCITVCVCVCASK